MVSIVDLERLVGPPSQPPIRVDWPAFEAALGLQLPSDYKDVFDVYRTLEFGQFVGVFHPGSDAEENRHDTVATLSPLKYMIDEMGGLEDVAAVDGEEERVRFAVYPEPGGLLLWGSTWNGDLCLWHTIGEDPNLWPTVITDSIVFWEYPNGMTEFLVGVMDQTIRCPIFPDDFPSSHRVRQIAD